MTNKHAIMQTMFFLTVAHATGFKKVNAFSTSGFNVTNIPNDKHHPDVCAPATRMAREPYPSTRGNIEDLSVSLYVPKSRFTRMDDAEH